MDIWNNNQGIIFQGCSRSNMTYFCKYLVEMTIIDNVRMLELFGVSGFLFIN